jgi:hypothetical protein
MAHAHAEHWKPRSGNWFVIVKVSHADEAEYGPFDDRLEAAQAGAALYRETRQAVGVRLTRVTRDASRH